jgi:hypothetical protein
MQNSKLSPANLVILIAGAVILIASFLAFYKLDVPSGLGIGDQTYNAWSGSPSALLGNATLPAIFGVIMALQVALTAFANVNLPDRVLGFTWNQIHLALGFQATIMMLAFLVRDNGLLDFGIGFFLMLLAAVALLVGAVMRTREGAATAY